MTPAKSIAETLPDGVVLIDKPAHMTSFGVVARLRRALGDIAAEAIDPRPAKRPKIKVGHTGTLDPFATGLMILVVGKQCRNAQLYSKLDKVYEATIRLGEVSTTGDPEGEITKMSPMSSPTVAQVQAVLKRFTGAIEQTPPAFSAIKINGQRAYKLARQGEAVEMPSRTITVHSLELLSYNFPELQVRAHVSSGTYIRTLAEDIGQALGTGAYCSQLRRTRVAQYDVANALVLPADQ